MLRATLVESNWKNVVTLETEHDYLCYGVFQTELVPLLINLYEICSQGVGIFSLILSLTLRMLQRFMLLKDNASNLKK